MMQRLDTPELLDEHDAEPKAMERSLRDLQRFNRWCGGTRGYRKIGRRLLGPRERPPVIDLCAGAADPVHSLRGKGTPVDADPRVRRACLDPPRLHDVRDARDRRADRRETSRSRQLRSLAVGNAAVEVDVAIIGAGPAGSTLAALLARRGIAVALIDRDTFPRDKLCGEFLSYDALPVLDALGVSIPQAPYIECCRIVARHRQYEFDLPHAARGVSRMLLDDLLFRTAVAAGATPMS